LQETKKERQGFEQKEMPSLLKSISLNNNEQREDSNSQREEGKKRQLGKGVEGATDKRVGGRNVRWRRSPLEKIYIGEGSQICRTLSKRKG